MMTFSGIERPGTRKDDGRFGFLGVAGQGMMVFLQDGLVLALFHTKQAGVYRNCGRSPLCFVWRVS